MSTQKNVQDPLMLFILRRVFWHTAVRMMHASYTYLCPLLCPISILLTTQGVDSR